MTQSKQALIKAKQNKINSMDFSQFMTADAVKNRVNQIIGGSNGATFITGVISAVNANSDLQECTNDSIFSAALLGATLNLSPSPQLGHYYLVPFNDKTKGKVAQFQIGYKGYIQLAIRTGQYKDLDVIEVREGEYKGRNRFSGKHQFEFIEDEVERETKPIVGYMAYFEYLNGFYKSMFWTKDKMNAHAKEYSKAYNYDLKNKKRYSFWSKDFDGMAFKTMLRQLISKWGIMSIELQTAYENDMAYISEDEKEYVDNPNTDRKIVEAEVKEVNINDL